MSTLDSVQFIHLNVHSDYSLVDSIVRVDALCEAALQNEMPAIALTDMSNLYAAIKFYKACWKRGVKPIIGADLWVRYDDESEPYRLILLCQNREGYGHLMALISESYLHGQELDRAVVHFDELKLRSNGLIALSNWREGAISQALIRGGRDKALEIVKAHQALFPDRFYIEIQRLGWPNEEALVQETAHLAAESKTPLVATNGVRFLKPEDDEAHEARVCIHDKMVLDDPKRQRKHSPQQYFKTEEEMAALFADLPSALANSVEIAKRCNLEISMGKNYLPDFPVPEGMSIDEFFTQESYAGLEERFKTILDPKSDSYSEQRQRYLDRLQTELDVIIQMEFPGYFLIVADFIRWAKENDIPVGPGRGSGAGSLVAYALKITDIDPMIYDLLFERFLNPERVSMPDFDVDFCTLGRDRVIAYVAEKYGRHAVSQIATHGTMAAKLAVRDVGRVLGLPYGQVDRVARLIPMELKITIAKALADEPELKSQYENDETIATLIDLAMKLEGVVRNVGRHAGGVVIAPTKLVDFSPLYCEHDGEGHVTQYDMKDVEEVGLVKFDFLGLSNLTIIDTALKLINAMLERKNKPPIDMAQIPLDDPKVYALLKRAATTAVFQLESRGMKDLIRRLRPDTFEDVIALVALFRPGPLGSGMVADFIARKHGEAEVTYPHPYLEPILKPTYGVILYQEQVMQVAQVLANYTLGAADLLRRAMGKKDKDEMHHQRALFVEGASKNDVDSKLAGEIFDLLEHFADYGFNKSHSAAYALVAYQTAWLKAHYSSWFMAAVLSADMDKTDKVVIFIEECRQLKIKVHPPDINRSTYLFEAISENEIVYGLGAIKGVGEGAICAMVAEREANGPFENLYDLCRRLDLSRFNRRMLEAALKAGAFDTFNSDRAYLFAQLDDAVAQAEQWHRDQQSGQDDLFGFAPAPESIPKNLPVEQGKTQVYYEKWSEAERLAYEKETLGLYLSGHPFKIYEKELSQLLTNRLVELESEAGESGSYRDSKSYKVAGLVLDIRFFHSEHGRRAAVLLDDCTTRYEVSLSGEVLERDQARLIKDSVLIVDGVMKYNAFYEQSRLAVDRIYQLENIRLAFAKELMLTLPPQTELGTIDLLQQTLSDYYGGGCRMRLNYCGKEAAGSLLLDEKHQLYLYDELVEKLEKIGDVEIKYR